MPFTPCQIKYAKRKSFYDGDDATLVARVAAPAAAPGAQGAAILKAEISSITHTLWRVYRGETPAIVAGRNAATVAKNDVWWDSLQGWEEDAFGYNFRDVIDESELAPDASYIAVYDIVFDGGESETLRFKFNYVGEDTGYDAGELPPAGGNDGEPGEGFNWRGEWNSLSAYLINDVVLWEDDLWIAVAVNSNSEPSLSSDDWDLYLPGATGSSESVDLLFSQVTLVSVHTTNEDTTLISGTLPAIAENTWDQKNVLVVKARGFYSTRDSLAGDLTLRVKLGGSAFLTFTVTDIQESQSNKAWKLDASFVRYSTGGSGTVFAWGEFSNAIDGVGFVTTPVSGTAAVTLASDVEQSVDVSADWENADSGNSITCGLLTVGWERVTT